jgi:hypothetical protein
LWTHQISRGKKAHDISGSSQVVFFEKKKLHLMLDAISLPIEMAMN